MYHAEVLLLMLLSDNMDFKINKQKLKDGDITSVLSFVYFISPEKLKKLFFRVGISIDNIQDVNALAEIAMKKLDVLGLLKNKDGNPVIFDTSKIVNNIFFSETEVSKIDEIIFE